MRVAIASMILCAGCSCGPMEEPVPDGSTPDAGGGPDAGALDAGTNDAGTMDAGTPDAGLPDAGGTPDSGAPLDAGPHDAGIQDLGDAGWERQIWGQDDFLYGIYGFSKTNVVIVGDFGARYRWDGNTGNDESNVGGADYVALFGAPDHYNDYWALSSGGGVDESYTTGSWVGAQYDAPLTGNDVAVAGWSESGDLYVVTRSGAVFHSFEGDTWDMVAYGPGNPDGGYLTVRAAWSDAPAQCWAVGYDGLAMHLNGTTWTKHAIGTSQALLGVWGRAADDVWAVGVDGLIFHWDGSAWTQTPTGSNAVLQAVYGFAANDVWAGGTSLFHWNGATWTEENPSPVEWTLTNIWGFSSDDVWAVGEFGFVLHRVQH
jgi:hypothetical protein